MRDVAFVSVNAFTLGMAVPLAIRGASPFVLVGAAILVLLWARAADRLLKRTQGGRP